MLKSTLKKIKFQYSIAWSQLSHQKMRLLVAMGGIAFANILIFMQLGFRQLFTSGATVLPESLKGDLFLLHPDSRFLGAIEFDRLRLYQAAGIKGVADTIPVYINSGVSWAYTQNYQSYEVRIVAFNPQKKVFNIAEINQQRYKISMPNSFLFDRFAQQELGNIVEDFSKAESKNTQPHQIKVLINRRKADIVGLFNLGNSFFLGTGNLITSEANYQEIFGNNILNRVSIGIVNLNPDVNPDAVKAGIKKNVPGINVYSHQELIAKELKYQEENPAGLIFSFGAIMGFIIGVVIVYQVLYADVRDHLAEYATLKAMGYSDIYLLAIIFQEATILTILGFIPGFLVSLSMYNFLASMTRLELAMTPELAVIVFLLTFVMCIVSAAIASSKLRYADPADVF
ncbi:ABC transporter permease DevC [Nodularia spumigena CS-584]|mgnify:CR=1 FL=1|jgi:putative ABC transport system permease protein|uniref:ABC transporter permease DevC n=2 Tax=Nodularia spumigena TaxID=70799 RepID=A0ABU5ULM1_NODSP|nr:ABC transporter permease DevC [Nodularia spumigena]AHJ29009.1 ABC transporter permease protein [Nodularia spumigena CCY9414]AVZ29703.1 putative ABC transport system permease protein [Nodularia spumigena UHCC 0039]EAW47293.1 ABC transporter permease protein [Nodularia spumigena CCY9414]MDB9381024.1 ABC transporter permease DevC [Nodularia spumigena CS-584]MEA5523724.1 ABC transporter permease DevC [Nodularia spumigena UHCC 0143]